jgi:hypothetical protein
MPPTASGIGCLNVCSIVEARFWVARDRSRTKTVARCSRRSASKQDPEQHGTIRLNIKADGPMLKRFHTQFGLHHQSNGSVKVADDAAGWLQLPTLKIASLTDTLPGT